MPGLARVGEERFEIAIALFAIRIVALDAVTLDENRHGRIKRSSKSDSGCKPKDGERFNEVDNPHHASSPFNVPVERLKESVSTPNRCNMEANKFAAGTRLGSNRRCCP